MTTDPFQPRNAEQLSALEALYPIALEMHRMLAKLLLDLPEVEEDLELAKQWDVLLDEIDHQAKQPQDPAAPVLTPAEGRRLFDVADRSWLVRQGLRRLEHLKGMARRSGVTLVLKRLTDPLVPPKKVVPWERH